MRTIILLGILTMVLFAGCQATAPQDEMQEETSPVPETPAAGEAPPAEPFEDIEAAPEDFDLEFDESEYDY